MMGDRGRLVIPAELRQRYGLAAGTPVALVETEQGLVLMTREQLKRYVQADCAGRGLVDALLEDRRREAETDVR